MDLFGQPVDGAAMRSRQGPNSSSQIPTQQTVGQIRRESRIRTPSRPRQQMHSKFRKPTEPQEIPSANDPHQKQVVVTFVVTLRASAAVNCWAGMVGPGEGNRNLVSGRAGILDLLSPQGSQGKSLSKREGQNLPRPGGDTVDCRSFCRRRLSIRLSPWKRDTQPLKPPI